MWVTGWLKARGTSEKFENLEVVELASLLQSFYAEARDKEGKRFSDGTMKGIRVSINRHIQLPPFNRTIDLVKDAEFTLANVVLEEYKKAWMIEKEISQPGQRCPL